jgi:hypothetical protein
MIQRRPKRLVPSLAPLAPELPEPLTPQLTPSQKLAILHKVLESERKKSARTINALTRYNVLLERVIASQREAFELLDKPLIPREWKEKK